MKTIASKDVIPIGCTIVHRSIHKIYTLCSPDTEATEIVCLSAYLRRHICKSDSSFEIDKIYLKKTFCRNSVLFRFHLRRRFYDNLLTYAIV